MNGWNKRRAYSEGFITIIILDEMVQIEDGNEQLKDRNDEKEEKRREAISGTRAQ